MLLVMRSNRRAASVLLVTGVSIIVLFLISVAIGQGQSNLPSFMQPILERASRFSPAHLADIFARMAMWKAAWSQTQASLLLGYGPAKGASFLLTSQTTDSEIFIVALRYGLVGLMIWVGIWYVFLRTGRQAAKARDRESQVVGRALWSLLVVNLLASGVTYTFLALRRMTLVCIFVGIAAAIARTDAGKRLAEARAGD
jgi:O-antigen ligase